MKRYPASMARERMSDVLDEVERSGAAVIERGDVQYVITVKRSPRRRRLSAGIEILDPAIASGEWGLDWRPGGVAFKTRPRRKK